MAVWAMPFWKNMGTTPMLLAMDGQIAPTSLTSLLKLAAYPFTLGLVAAVLCYLAAGLSLGLFLGPVAAASLIVPPMVAAARDRVSAIIVAGSVGDAIGIVWLFAVLSPDVSIVQWLACYAILIAYVFGLAGLVWLLRGVIGSLASVSIVTITAVAWLAWPVWTSPWLTAPVAAWLSPAHPLLAINHVLLDLGVWTQQPWMYRHTALGQDVAYTLPTTIWPTLIIHAVMALGLALPARVEASPPRSELSPAPAAP